MSQKVPFNVKGYNPDIDSAANEVVKSNGGTFTKMSVGTLTIVSDSTDDDNVASGTLTLVSAVANEYATGTVTCASVQEGDTVTVNALVYTAVSGTKADNTEFSIDTSDDATATDLADSISNDSREGTLGVLSASATTDTVTITTNIEGTAGNAVTLASSDGVTLAVSGATFSGGVDADTATVNGLVYTAVAGTKADNTEFSIDTDDTAAAADLADSINNDVRDGVTVPSAVVSATSALGVVTIEATTLVPVGNSVDISGSDNITASGAELAVSGTGARVIEINGLDEYGKVLVKRFNLNGTTDVVSAEDWSAVNSCRVVSVGSGGTNAGNISITDSSDVQSYITASVGQSEDAIFNVPSNGYSLINGITVSATDSNAIVSIYIKSVDENGVLSRIAAPIIFDVAAQNNSNVMFGSPLVVNSNGYWYIEANSTQNNVKASVEVNHVLMVD